MKTLLILAALSLAAAGCGVAANPRGQTGANQPTPAAPTDLPAAAPTAGPTAEAPGGAGELSPGDLAGATWALTSYGPTGSPVEVPAGAGVTAEFAEGQVRGSTGCNSYSGDYTLVGATITTTEIVQTLIGCEPAVQRQEEAYTEALRTATRYQIEGDAPTIEHAGRVLRFIRQQPAADQPLEGTAWPLTTFVAGEVARSLLSGTQITAEFAQGKLSGTAGCNQCFGSYSTADQALAISEFGSTKMACAGEILTQEQDFLNVLGAATVYTIEGDQLTIERPGGQLVFTAALATQP